MAIRNIKQVDDPILKKKSRPITEFDGKLGVLIDDMKDTLIKSNGCGLAAVQVGVLRRVIVVEMHKNYVELVNPEIIYTEGEQIDVEGCLSLPGWCGKTVRPALVRVRAQNREGKWCLYEGTELMARCFCHEIDHLDGILFSQRLAPGEKLERR